MILEQSKEKTRPELFIQLYEEAFPMAAVFIKKMGGNLEDAKDIFQDALLVYYEKVTQEKFVAQVNDKVYLLGICKNLWFKRIQKSKQVKAAQQLPETMVKEEVQPVAMERVLSMVEQSGKKCLELLQSFYFEKCNMKEIAKRFGFAGERSATAQKYKCLEKVRAEIKEKSLMQEDFYE